MKQLIDGERKVIHSKFRDWDGEIKVEAYRMDCDTPMIILTDRGGNNEVYLSDVGACALVERINKALSILPSSK